MQFAFLWAKNKTYHWFLNIFVASIALRIFVIKIIQELLLIVDLIVQNCRKNTSRLIKRLSTNIISSNYEQTNWNSKTTPH